MYKRILVATDGSELSQKAVTNAASLAAVCKAELVVVKIVPRYPQTYFEGAMSLTESDAQRIEAQWAKDSQAVVDAAVQQAGAAGVTATGKVVKSDIVSDAIIKAAKDEHADLIVMSSHGRKGISRLLLGSETQQVLTHSEIPVLVLR
jgi:nucleotide-binding universal stress UspA family protein